MANSSSSVFRSFSVVGKEPQTIALVPGNRFSAGPKCIAEGIYHLSKAYSVVFTFQRLSENKHCFKREILLPGAKLT